jgi:hypothetical protein
LNTNYTICIIIIISILIIIFLFLILFFILCWILLIIYILWNIIRVLYLVKVISVEPGYEKKIPLETELCGVLVRFVDFGYYRRNQLCLFKTDHLFSNYIGGEPIFDRIVGGTVAPPNDFAQYQTIVNACVLQTNDYVRIDLETFAQIKEVIALKDGLEGSEFLVKLTSGNRFFRETSFRKNQLVKGVLRRRPFQTNVTTTSLLAYSFDVYQLDITPIFKNKLVDNSR